MPRHAIERAPVDYVVPVSEMAPLLVRLVDTPAPDPSSFPVPEQMAIESNLSNTPCGRPCAHCRKASSSRAKWPRAHANTKDLVAQRFEEKAREAEANAESLRNILMKDKAPV